jgi:hypothetical protein
MGNLYRGPSIDASYLVSVDLAMRFQRRRFVKFDPNSEIYLYICDTQVIFVIDV